MSQQTKESNDNLLSPQTSVSSISEDDQAVQNLRQNTSLNVDDKRNNNIKSPVQHINSDIPENTTKSINHIHQH